MRNFVKSQPVRLRQVRVLNWHSIIDRTIDVPDTGILIFGSNGSGKTTLQDAIQFGLFPDERTVRFNAAVADTATDRNVLGYVLQKLDDGADNRPLYKWEARTSYIVLTFERGTEQVTFLVGIAGDSDRSRNKLLASLPGVPDLRGLPVVDTDRRVVPLDSVERWIRTHRGHIYDTVAAYIGDISAFHGSPHQDWPQLLKSSIGFKEIRDATDFVRRFLEEKTIDHKSLFETFQSYERLREEAERTEEWIRVLRGAVGPDVDDQGRRLPLESLPALHVYRHYRGRALMYEVGLARIPVMLAELQKREHQDALAHVESAFESLEIKGRTLDARKADLNLEVRRLDSELRGRGIAQEMDTLQEKVRGANSDVEAATEAQTRVRRYIHDISYLLPICASEEIRSLAIGEDAVLRQVQLLSGDGVHRITELVEDPDGVDLRRAGGFRHIADEGEQAVGAAMERLSARDSELRTRLQDLESERNSLRLGRPRYPAGVEAARALLRDRLGWTDARPLCEMIEVPEEYDEWRRAVEAELGWSRFDFVVPSHLFDAASKLYEQYRERGYPGADGRKEKLFDVSLIDVGKIREDRANRAEDGSLAEKVASDCSDAEDYIAYALGRVACEHDVRRLRRHRRAITPSLIAYGGYKLFSHNAERLQLFIGAHAREIRLTEVERLIQQVTGELDLLRGAAAKVSDLYHILRSALQSFERFEDDVRVARELGGRRERLSELQAQLRRLRENAEHRDLVAQFEATQRALNAIEEERTKVGGDKAVAEETIGRLKEQIEVDRTNINRHQKAAEGALAELAPEEREIGEAGFAGEIARRAGDGGVVTEQLLHDFHASCHRQAIENNREAGKANLRFQDIITKYREATGFAVAVDVSTPEPIEEEYQRLIDTALPEQRKRLDSKASEMREGVVQGVLHSLGARFMEVQRLVGDISHSTRSIETRLGRFSLVAKPIPEWKHIHDLALQAMTVLSFEQLAHTNPDDPFVRSVEEFMGMLVKNEAQRDRLCDYRTYLDFEIHNCPVAGTVFKPFRGTRKGGSGGERQVPYYVMTLALMDHVYRRGARANQYMGRLLLMDEVFHNMSDDNVRDVMRLARDLELQIIMVTPGKLRTLAPLFGKTIQAAKDIIDPVYPTRFIEYEQDELPEDLLNFEEYEEGAYALA